MVNSDFLKARNWLLMCAFQYFKYLFYFNSSAYKNILLQYLIIEMHDYIQSMFLD